METTMLLKRRPWGIAGAIVLFVVVLISIFAPVVSPYEPNQISVTDRSQPPGGGHIMGTDNLGRDIFSRVLYGTRPYVLAGLVATGMSIVLGLVFGTASATLKGKIDSFLSILVIGLSVIVGISILLLVARLPFRFLPSPLTYLTTALRPTAFVTLYVPLLLSFLLLPTMYNIMRTAFSSKPFRSVVARVTSTALVGFGVSIGLAVMIITPLSYIGFGVSPPTPEWGSMLSGSGRAQMSVAPWIWQYPLIAIIVVLLGAILLGIAAYELWFPHLAPRHPNSTVNVQQSTVTNPK